MIKFWEIYRNRRKKEEQKKTMEEQKWKENEPIKLSFSFIKIINKTKQNRLFIYIINLEYFLETPLSSCLMCIERPMSNPLHNQSLYLRTRLLNSVYQWARLV